ncbi:MAG: hypothetical protein Q8O89_05030 [Nanoarchaeota archaeon]|nr:hypothetical protein [Nanoarchaeota archaeon]
MDIEVTFEMHAIKRLIARSEAFGMECDEAKCLAIETAVRGKKSFKHVFRNHLTNSRYFNNGLTFFTVFRKKRFGARMLISIKTVIIERGR